jgi:hypothetical protein
MAHLQGPVPLIDRDYIARPFELELQRELMADRWVLLLGPRQHGKTSALVRLQTSLMEIGMPTALVDLQAAPALQTYAQFARWVSSEARRQFGTADAPLVDSEDIGVLFEASLDSSATPAVILIDEASNIPDAGWRNAFYGQLRAISSRRAIASATDPSARLRFVFAGTFRPETLIDMANSPFNVCERVDSSDLTLEDVKKLTSDILGAEQEAFGVEIFEFVGGQPFLVQKLLSRVRRRDSIEAALEAEFSELLTGQSDHIVDLFRKMLSDPELAAIGARMVRDGAAPLEAADPNYRYMQVLGLARRSGSNLVFRNRLYSEIAAASPQLGGTAPAPNLAPMFPVSKVAFAKVRDAELREIAWSAHKGAVAAYRAGSNRIALAGFGGSLEAMLLDVMLRQSSGEIARIVSAARITFDGRENKNNPRTWNLSSLIKAAPHVGAGRPFEPPQALREWRNLIHPALAQRNYRLDTDLEPEARSAANLHEILLRDLP